MPPLTNNREYSEQESEIVDLIFNGRTELNIHVAKKYFEEAKKKSEYIFNNSEISYSLFLNALTELADIESNIQKRILLWQQLITKTIVFLNQYPTNEELLISGSDILSSYINEQFLNKDFALVKKALTILKSKIDQLISIKGLSNCPHLLIKKASSLRNYSRFQPTKELQIETLNQAKRCVEKSISIDDSRWYTYLELGNCFLKASHHETKLSSFNELIKKAEESFKNSQSLLPTVNNTLALCSLYKDTFQTAPFLSSFKSYELIEKNKRRFLQNSVDLGEITTRMYYSGFPSDILNEYTLKSERLLSEAINSGYNDARTITDLAFIKAINGQISIGERILKTLKTSSSAFNWNIIIEDIKLIRESNDLFEKGFVLGIDDASIWNKLGTFAIDFLSDNELAIKMYKVALHFNKSNPIALTNISRALIKKVPLKEEDINDAEYYISNAANSSNFRFQWWRDVREEVENVRSNFSNTPKDVYKKNYNFTKISDIYKYYLFLKGVTDTQSRGYKFERLIERYFDLSLGNSFGSHKIKTSHLVQIDSAFFFDKDFYRVEAKWTEKEVDHTVVDIFFPKLNTIGVSGLIISINGFTNSAVERSKELKNEKKIILMDGEELEATLRGSPTFDEAMRLKQLYFVKENNPYYKIAATKQNF